MSNTPGEISNGRIGLVVAEFQTFHLGHQVLLAHMAGACDTAIVALGSCDKFGRHGHPFTFEQRVEQVKGVFGDRFEFVALKDIDATADNDDWMRYVLKRIEHAGLEAPTDYFTGSEIDARWYQNYFPKIGSAECTALGHVSRYSAPVDGAMRRLHIVDRGAHDVPSGREIRFLIERRDEDWKNYVPARLWKYIEWHYPPHLRQAIQTLSVAEHEQYPVGTRVRLRSSTQAREWGGQSGDTFVLQDDGKWRMLRAQVDEKETWAHQMIRDRIGEGA